MDGLAHLHDNAHIVAPLQAQGRGGSAGGTVLSAGHICLYPSCLLRSAFNDYKTLPHPISSGSPIAALEVGILLVPISQMR